MSSLYLDESLVAADVGGTITLGGAEARHAIAVNRSRAGDAILVGNGAGLLVSGEITVVDGDQVTIAVTEVAMVPDASPRLILAQALAKGDRDELAIQAATELGVSAIVPWAAARSVSRWEGAKIEKGRLRWATIVREAAKQSIRAFVPPVETVASTAALLKFCMTHRVLVLEPSASERLSAIDFGGDQRDVVLVVGPEGGVSGRELEQFAEAGASIVKLGDTVLRTSSAGPAALAVANVALGRW